MRRLIDPNDIHSAADSWSGFLYQGKIALFHVLRLLNEDDQALDYHLQLDSLEDFAIVDDNIDPITLHQVKAMKSVRYSSYTEAFVKLEKRIQEFPCRKACFHLANQNENTAAEILTAHPKMEVYEYPWGDHHCSLNEINTRLDGQIQSFLGKNDLGHYDNPQNVNTLRNKLEAIICNQIIDIHACNHTKNGLTIEEGAYHFIIPFDSFDQILKSDPTKELDEDYFLFLTKELLNHYYTDFCIELENEKEDEGGIDEADMRKLDRYMQQINKLEGQEVISFLQSILPHRTVKLDSIIGFKDDNIKDDEFKDAFLRSLYELVVCPGKICENFLWRDNNSIGYTVTAIKDGQRNARVVCSRIYNNINDTDVEVPYETDKLITLELEVNSIMEELKLHTPRGEDEAQNGTQNNVLRWSKISLVKLDNAKNALE